MASVDRIPLEQGSLLDGTSTEYPDAVVPTGDPSVDRLVHRLGELAELPSGEQPAAFEHLHDELLAELNTEHS